MSSNKNSPTVIQTIEGVLTLMSTMSADQNYASFTQMSRVEPNAIVDSSLIFNENTGTVLQSLHSAFTAYYLLSWSIFNLDVNQVQTLRSLNPKNTIRSKDILEVGDNLISKESWNITLENYQYKLPNYSKEALEAERLNLDERKFGYQQQMDERKFQHQEQKDIRQDERENNKFEYQKNRDKKTSDLDERKFAYQQIADVAKTKTVGVTSSMDMNNAIKELANLSVGKIIEIKVSNGLKDVTVPVSIRLVINSMKSDLLVSFISNGNVDRSFSTRWIKYRSGQINMLDLITARDLVAKHKELLIKDKTGLQRELSKHRNAGIISGILNMFKKGGGLSSVKPSVANSTNMILISHDTARRIELETNGKLDNFRFRQNLFNNTGLFILAVYDTEYERVKFYTNSIANPSDLSIRDCRDYNKKEGSSVLDMMKAYQMGTSPGF